jgi:hypothetical protein
MLLVLGVSVLVALTTSRLAAVLRSFQAVEFAERLDFATRAALFLAHP